MLALIRGSRSTTTGALALTLRVRPAAIGEALGWLVRSGFLSPEITIVQDWRYSTATVATPTTAPLFGEEVAGMAAKKKPMPKKKGGKCPK